MILLGVVRGTHGAKTITTLNNPTIYGNKINSFFTFQYMLLSKWWYIGTLEQYFSALGHRNPFNTLNNSSLIKLWYHSWQSVVRILWHVTIERIVIFLSIWNRINELKTYHQAYSSTNLPISIRSKYVYLFKTISFIFLKIRWPITLRHAGGWSSHNQQYNVWENVSRRWLRWTYTKHIHLCRIRGGGKGFVWGNVTDSNGCAIFYFQLLLT